MDSLNNEEARREEVRRALAAPQPPTPRRIVASRQQLHLLGVTCSDPTLWKLIKDGEFPQPVKIGKSNYWLVDELETWLAEQPRVADRRRTAESEAQNSVRRGPGRPKKIKEAA